MDIYKWSLTVLVQLARVSVRLYENINVLSAKNLVQGQKDSKLAQVHRHFLVLRLFDFHMVSKIG